MDETIIYLGANESLPSAVEKLKLARPEYVVLVVPRGAEILKSLVNLKIVKAEADALNKSLVLVTEDEGGRNLAKLAGIYSLESMPDKSLPEEIESLPPEKVQFKINYKGVALDEPPATESRKFHFKKYKFSLPHLDWDFDPKAIIAPKFLRKVGLITGGIILLLMMVVPRAHIEAQVLAKPVNTTLPLKLIDPAISKQPEGEVIKGRFIDTLQESTQNFQATGTVNEGTKARGRVRVTNKTPALIGLKADTRFQAGQLVFRVPSDVLVASGGTEEVAIVADEAGTAGNVPAKTKFTVPGLGPQFSDLISAEAIEDFSGGEDKLVAVITEEDLNTAQKQISEAVRAESLVRLTRQLKKNEKIHPNLIQVDLVDLSPSGKVGDKGTDFNMKVRIRAWTLAFPPDTIPSIEASFIAKAFGANYRLTDKTVEDASIKITSTDFGRRLINFDLRLQGQTYQELRHEEWKWTVTGRPVAESAEYLKSLTGMKDVRIKTVPSFYQRMPLMPFRISTTLRFANS